MMTRAPRGVLCCCDMLYMLHGECGRATVTFFDCVIDMFVDMCCTGMHERKESRTPRHGCSNLNWNSVIFSFCFVPFLVVWATSSSSSSSHLLLDVTVCICLGKRICCKGLRFQNHHLEGSPLKFSCVHFGISYC
jgi:hypothetical protein